MLLLREQGTCLLDGQPDNTSSYSQMWRDLIQRPAVSWPRQRRWWSIQVPRVKACSYTISVSTGVSGKEVKSPGARYTGAFNCTHLFVFGRNAVSIRLRPAVVGKAVADQSAVKAGCL